MKAYILTVDEASGPRTLHAKKEAEKLSIDWQFVKGVQSEDASISSAYSKLRNFLSYHRNMTQGEIERET